MFNPFAPIEIIPAQLPEAPAPEAAGDAAAYSTDDIPEGVGAFDYAPEAKESASSAPAEDASAEDAPVDPTAPDYGDYASDPTMPVYGPQGN